MTGSEQVSAGQGRAQDVERLLHGGRRVERLQLAGGKPAVVPMNAATKRFLHDASKSVMQIGRLHRAITEDTLDEVPVSLEGLYERGAELVRRVVDLDAIQYLGAIVRGSRRMKPEQRVGI